MKKLLILIILAAGAMYITKDEDYVEIPSTSIRMRVIAASDKKEDQAKKIEIKSVLEQKLYEIIDGENDIEVIDKKIMENKEIIDKAIEEKIKSDDMRLSFTSNYGKNYFPEKTFKGLTYKAGNYQSYVVTLGEGKGENWWCVLYPPLCLIDESNNEYEYHYLIKDILDKYN